MLGGEYGGYWYDYYSSEYGGSVGIEKGGEVEATVSIFVAFNLKGNLHPDGISGPYITESFWFGVESGVTVNVGGSYELSDEWLVLNIEASAGYGPKFGLAGTTLGKGEVTVLNPAIKTNDRSDFDKYFVGIIPPFAFSPIIILKDWE